MRWVRLWERVDDGGEVSAAVDPSATAASQDTVRLQLTVWEQCV